MGKERRNFFRHPIDVPLKLRVVRSDSLFDSNTSDISLGGLNFAWSKKFHKGALLEIKIPVKEKLFDVKAKVVFSKEERRSARYHTGVHFVDFPGAFKTGLAEEILQIMEYRKIISRDLGREVPEEEASRKWLSQFETAFPIPSPQKI